MKYIVVVACALVALQSCMVSDAAPFFPFGMGLMPPPFMAMFQPVFNPFNIFSVIQLAAQMPPYIYRLTVHNGDVFAYARQPLTRSNLDYLSVVLHRNGLYEAWVVYDCDQNANKPITVDTANLPKCDNDVCPIKESTIAAPTTTTPAAQPDITVVPPTSNTPAAVAPVTPPVTPPMTPPVAAQIPTPPPVQNDSQVTKMPEGLATPSELEDAARRLNLSLFGRSILRLIQAGDYESVKQKTLTEFDIRMKKLQTDLARLESRKKEVIQGTSPDDEIDSDMVKLAGMVSHASDVLTKVFNDRRKAFISDVARMATDKSFQGLSAREAAFVAARLEGLVYDPVAESKRALKAEKEKIQKV